MPSCSMSRPRSRYMYHGSRYMYYGSIHYGTAAEHRQRERERERVRERERE